MLSLVLGCTAIAICHSGFFYTQQGAEPLASIFDVLTSFLAGLRFCVGFMLVCIEIAGSNS